MTRHRLPLLLAVAASACAVAVLAGCTSGGGAIDIPDGAAAPISTTAPEQTAAPATTEPAPIAPAPTTAATAAAIPTIDCEKALPVATVADDLDLPTGFVTLTAGGGAGSCSYAMAGNTGALQFSWSATDQTADELLAPMLADAPDAERIVFGDGALVSTPTGEFVGTQPLVLVSLAGGIQLSSYSYVGDADQVKDFARAIYDALGVSVG